MVVTMVTNMAIVVIRYSCNKALYNKCDMRG